MNAAQHLSIWLENTHPDVFNALYNKIAAARQRAVVRNARLKGFGDDGDVIDASFSDFTPNLSDVSVDIPNMSSVGDMPDFSNPTLESVGSPSTSIDSAVSASITPDTSSIPISTDSSSGFLNSLGSGIADAAGSVAKFLTSPQGLASLATVGTAYFKMQSNQANAQVQSQVLQAQIARASAGLSPLPVSYITNSAGQTVPFYPLQPGQTLSSLPAALQQAIIAGTAQPLTLSDGEQGYTVPANIVGALGAGISVTQLLPWLLGGALVLALLSR